MSNSRYEIAPGRPHPLVAVPDADGVNFSVFSRNATSVELLLFDEHDDREPAQIIKLDAGGEQDLLLLARLRRRAAARRPLRLPGRRPGGPSRAGLPLQPQQGAHRPLRLRQHRRPLEPGRRLRPGRQPGNLDAERGHRHCRLRLGGRSTAQRADERDGHLRDARRRLHAAPVVGSRASGHVFRDRREDTLSARSWGSRPWNCCR